MVLRPPQADQREEERLLPEQWRVLAIDDEVRILDAYQEVLDPKSTRKPLQLLQALGMEEEESWESRFRLDCELSGQVGVERLKEACEAEDPYAVVLLDMRMPSGWDGLTTAEEIRKVDSEVRIILTSAYMDYSLTEVRARIGVNFQFLAKPVQAEELMQLTLSMANQWGHVYELVAAKRELEQYRNELEQLVEQRTAALERSKERSEGLLEFLVREKNQSDLILESIREGLVVVDRLGRIQQVNQRLEEMVGQPEGMLIGKPLRVLFAKDDKEDSDTLGMETLTLVRSRLQAMLEQKQLAIHNWSEASLVAAMVVDEEGTICECNPAMEELSGWSAAELIGGTLDPLLPPEIRETHSEMSARFIAQGEVRRMGGDRLLPLVHRSGAMKTVEIGLLPLRIEEKNQVLVLLHDPEEEQQWELFLMTPFGKLFVEGEESEEVRVDWQMQHQDGSTTPVHVSGAPFYLHEGDIRQFNGAVLVLHDLGVLLSAESAKQANQAKDEFLASMSHELRTPLSSIIGNCELLAETPLRVDQLELLRAIEISGRGQLSLINDILDLSKIESGKFQIDRIPYVLDHLIDEVCHICSSKARDARLLFKVNQEVRPTHQLLGDKRRIGQILINLLGNAIKFTDHGEVTLTVRIDNRLRFIVEDTGIGMGPEVKERLFQRFEQADQTISERFGGTGLGLHISGTLAELMDGKIEVESEEGKGSRFELSLPCVFSEQGAQQQDSDAPALQQTTATFQGKVLVAEDTPELQLLLRRLLESMGVDVRMAANGREAMEMALDGDFDLVLMDMQMPEMNGIEATGALRKRGYKAPIVAVTANVMQKHREQFHEVGCSAFLTKPVERTELLQVLKQYLTLVEEHEEASQQAGSLVDDEVMALFYERLDTLRRQLVVACKQESWREVGEVVHVIKGSGTNFGYPSLTRLGRMIQEAIKAGDFRSVSAMAIQLERSVEEILNNKRD